MINVDDLLKPLGDGKPCGEDFSYHPSLQKLETLTQGTPEVEMGEFKKPAEEPDWKAVRDQALEVLNQTKHLTPGVILTAALLKIGGLEGFRDGLALMRGYTEKYWAELYPKLDPEDNNDPTERLNILNQLSSTGKPCQVLVHLRGMVLCSSQSMGRVTLEQYLAAKGENKSKSPDGSPAKPTQPDLNQIQAAFRDAGPEAAKATFALVNEAVGHAKAIEGFLDAALGAGRSVNFEALNKMLDEMKHAIAPYATNGAPAAEAAGEIAGAAPAQGGMAPPVKAVSGIVQNRADVIKALDLICDYYRDHEPSSPVPLILQRAQRLVEKDFMAIMTDLNPDAVRQLQVITGSKPKE